MARTLLACLLISCLLCLATAKFVVVVPSTIGWETLQEAFKVTDERSIGNQGDGVRAGTFGLAKPGDWTEGGGIVQVAGPLSPDESPNVFEQDNEDIDSAACQTPLELFNVGRDPNDYGGYSSNLGAFDDDLVSFESGSSYLVNCGVPGQQINIRNLKTCYMSYDQSEGSDFYISLSASPYKGHVFNGLFVWRFENVGTTFGREGKEGTISLDLSVIEETFLEARLNQPSESVNPQDDVNGHMFTIISMVGWCSQFAFDNTEHTAIRIKKAEGVPFVSSSKWPCAEFGIYPSANGAPPDPDSPPNTNSKFYYVMNEEIFDEQEEDIWPWLPLDPDSVTEEEFQFDSILARRVRKCDCQKIDADIAKDERAANFYRYLEVPYFYRHYLDMNPWEAVVVSPSFAAGKTLVFNAEDGTLDRVNVNLFPKPHSHLSALTPSLFLNLNDKSTPFWISAYVPVTVEGTEDIMYGFYFDGLKDDDIREGAADYDVLAPSSIEQRFQGLHPFIRDEIFGGLSPSQYIQGSTWFVRGLFGVESLDSTDQRLMRFCIHGGIVALSKTFETRVDEGESFDEFDFYGGYFAEGGRALPTPVTISVILEALADASASLELDGLSVDDIGYFSQIDVFERLYATYSEFKYLDELFKQGPARFNYENEGAQTVKDGTTGEFQSCGLQETATTAYFFFVDNNFAYCVPYYVSVDAPDILLDTPDTKKATWIAYNNAQAIQFASPKGSYITQYPKLSAQARPNPKVVPTRCEIPGECELFTFNYNVNYALEDGEVLYLCPCYTLGQDATCMTQGIFPRDRDCVTFTENGKGTKTVQLPASPFYGSIGIVFLIESGKDQRVIVEAEEEGSGGDEFAKRSIAVKEDAEETEAATGSIVVVTNGDLVVAADNANPGGVQSRKRVLQVFTFKDMFPVVKGSCL